MSTLSVRKLPKDVERALQREAKTSGKTKTEIVIDALATRLHVRDAKKRRPIREFFGKMSREEYETFKAAIADFEKVDEEMRA